MINRSDRTAIGIDGCYAMTLFHRFWPNSSVYEMLRHDCNLTTASAGMREDSVWEFSYRIQNKFTGEYRDISYVVNWKTENVEI